MFPSPCFVVGMQFIICQISMMDQWLGRITVPIFYFVLSQLTGIRGGEFTAL